MRNRSTAEESARDYTLRMLGQGQRRQRIHKALGQNFLIDDNVVTRFIEALPEQASPVLEVGAGLGVLTRRLAARESEIWAVELDKAKAAILKAELSSANLTVLQADALSIDLRTIWGARQGWLMGNLPYYITSPLLLHFLKQTASLQGMLIMIQKEVAARITAVPGSKAYGILSIAVQVAAQAETLFDVPPGAFLPAPKVTSAVLRLQMRSHPEVTMDRTLFFQVVKAAFANRRKTIANSLSGTYGLDKQIVLRCLSEAGIEEKRRAETINLAEFQKLALKLAPVLPSGQNVKR